jgi:hypothetical protein
MIGSGGALVAVAQMPPRTETARTVRAFLQHFPANLTFNLAKSLFKSIVGKKKRTALVLDRSGFIGQCLCFIDSLRLRQILVHLIDNAIKFLDKGYVCFGYRQISPTMLEFKVEDTGVGIPESQQKVIFERFRKSGQARNKQHSGTGLGLTISHSLAQMMGGDMRVESIEQLGSTFYFTVSYLPVSPAKMILFELVPATKSAVFGTFAGKTLLLAEAQALKLIYYEKLLSSFGFTVIRADLTHPWFESVNEKTDVAMVSASVAVNTRLDAGAVNRFRTPVIYIASEKSEKYEELADRHPTGMMIEPLNDDELLQTLKQIMKM